MSVSVTPEPSVGELMTRRFVAVAPEDTLGETAERLAEADAGSALVVDHGRLVGILTSRDLVRALAGRVHASEARVRDWMSSEPATVTVDTPGEEAARLMVSRGFPHLPVVDGDRPLGMVGLRAAAGGLRAVGAGW